MKYQDTPVSIFGTYLQNVASGVSDDDTAWVIGVQYNKAKAPGTWDVRYLYMDQQKDAVVSALTDSDFIGGGTGGRGHELNFNYVLAKNVSTGVSLFSTETAGDADFQMVQLDLQLKF